MFVTPAVAPSPWRLNSTNGGRWSADDESNKLLQTGGATLDCASAEAALNAASFWARWQRCVPMNARQTNQQQVGQHWRVVPNTVLREIADLLARGVLRKTPGGGRCTGHERAD